MVWFMAFLAALSAYLLGSIPFGFLIAKSRGVDIREKGSGNIGATNVLRVVGKKEGILAFFLDFLKGLVAVLFVQRYLVPTPEPGVLEDVTAWFSLVAIVFVIVGHNYTCWLGFKGGKGIATSAGALSAVMPLVLLCAVAVWVLLFFTTKYVSVASIGAGVSLPIFEAISWKLGHSALPYMLVALVLAFSAVWRHKSNIEKLRRGEEFKFGEKKKAAEAAAAMERTERPE